MRISDLIDELNGIKTRHGNICVYMNFEINEKRTGIEVTQVLLRNLNTMDSEWEEWVATLT